jgi:hypothetical protein
MESSRRELTITGTLQREAWLQRVMPPPEQLAADLWSLPVPIPKSPLRYVSAYAFGTGEGLVLIDVGWDTEESWRSLLDGLRFIGAGPADVRGVLVTHMHFDHIGLAGRLREASGAWIALHPADHAVLARPDYRSADLAVARETEFLCGLGASSTEAAAVVGSAEQWARYTSVALPPATSASSTSGPAGSSPATTSCHGSRRISRFSAPIPSARSRTTSPRWPRCGTSTWRKSCRRTSGALRACPNASTPSRLTTNGGSPSCLRSYASDLTPRPGNWPGT